MEPPGAPPGGELQKHALGRWGGEVGLKSGSCLLHRLCLSPHKARDPFVGFTCAAAAGFAPSGAFLPLSCLFPRSALFPRSLSAPVRELLADVHAAQRARAFQLSAFNPLCQFALMLQREI